MDMQQRQQGDEDEKKERGEGGERKGHEKSILWLDAAAACALKNFKVIFSRANFSLCQVRMCFKVADWKCHFENYF